MWSLTSSAEAQLQLQSCNFNMASSLGSTNDNSDRYHELAISIESKTKHETCHDKDNLTPSFSSTQSRATVGIFKLISLIPRRTFQAIIGMRRTINDNLHLGFGSPSTNHSISPANNPRSVHGLGRVFARWSPVTAFSSHSPTDPRKGFVLAHRRPYLAAQGTRKLMFFCITRSERSIKSPIYGLVSATPVSSLTSDQLPSPGSCQCRRQYHHAPAPQSCRARPRGKMPSP